MKNLWYGEFLAQKIDRGERGCSDWWIVAVEILVQMIEHKVDSERAHGILLHTICAHPMMIRTFVILNLCPISRCCLTMNQNLS